MDTILTAFAIPSQPVLDQWLARFTSRPKVVQIPGGNSTAFSIQGSQAARDFPGYILARNPQHRAQDRIAVVTFSAGWGFVHSLSQAPEAIGRVDSVVLLDGLHTEQGLHGLGAYAARCSYGGLWDPMLVMTHSQIEPPYVSAKTTNERLMRSAKATTPRGLQPLPLYFSSPRSEGLPCPSPLEPVELGNQYGHARYTTDPIADYDNAGNAWRIEYQGTNAAIHIYIANYVQPRAWAMLAERCNVQSHRA